MAYLIIPVLCIIRFVAYLIFNVSNNSISKFVDNKPVFFSRLVFLAMLLLKCMLVYLLIVRLLLSWYLIGFSTPYFFYTIFFFTLDFLLIACRESRLLSQTSAKLFWQRIKLTTLSSVYRYFRAFYIAFTAAFSWIPALFTGFFGYLTIDFFEWQKSSPYKNDTYIRDGYFPEYGYFQPFETTSEYNVMDNIILSFDGHLTYVWKRYLVFKKLEYLSNCDPLMKNLMTEEIMTGEHRSFYFFNKNEVDAKLLAWDNCIFFRNNYFPDSAQGLSVDIKPHSTMSLNELHGRWRELRIGAEDFLFKENGEYKIMRSQITGTYPDDTISFTPIKTF